jgi:hypothetical protein
MAKNKHTYLDDDEDDSGQSGQTGQIAFRDFLAANERLRDDLLPPDEKKRLLIVHRDLHKDYVKKQKEAQDQRQALKEGKVSLHAYRQEKGLSGTAHAFSNHPILSNKAQFSGIDKQVNALPNENLAETNPKNRHELELRLTNRLTNQPKNTFNPKPQFR